MPTRKKQIYLLFAGDLKGAAIFLFCEEKAKMASWGRAKFPSGNLCVTKSPRVPTRKKQIYLLFAGDLKGVAIFLFCEAKAKMASRGRAKFPSGNLCVAKSPRVPTREKQIYLL